MTRTSRALMGHPRKGREEETVALRGREEGKPKGQGEKELLKKRTVQHRRSLQKLARRILEGWVLKRQNCG